MITDKKWFPFEKKLNGLACKEMAMREYHRDMYKYEWYAEGNWKLSLNVRSEKYPMEFSVANFKQTHLRTFFI